MRYFNYQLTHRDSGTSITGVIESESLDLAQYQLQMTPDYFITSLRHVSSMTRLTMRLRSSVLLFSFGLSTKDVLFFSKELITFLEAGFSLLDALRLLNKVVQKRVLRLLVSNLIQSLESGRSFSEALSVYSSLFSEGYVVSVRSAEASGQLVDILKENTHVLEWELNVVRSFLKAMFIPVFVFSLLFVMSFFIIFFLVPRIIPFLERSGKAIPPTTQVLIMLKELLTVYSGAIGTFFLVGGLCVVGFYFTRFGRYRMDTILLKLPLIGKVYLSFMCMKFSKLFHLLFKSGLRITDCLELCSGLFRRGVFEKEVREVTSKVREGRTLSEGFTASSFFPVLFTQMVVAGELTSSLTIKLEQLAIVFTSHIQDRTTAIISSIEFIYIGTLLLYIFIILFGLYVPMISVVVP